MPSGQAPAPSGGISLLDEYLPAWDVREAHSVWLPTTAPSQAFGAFRALTPLELPLFRRLLWVRALPARIVGRQGVSPDARSPLLEGLLAEGFVLLDERPDEQLMLGAVGKFWKPDGGSFVDIDGRDEFKRFDALGYAKAAIGFWVSDEEHGCCFNTETRVLATDEASRRRFALYWRLISPASGAIRSSWLRAVRRRSEAGRTSMSWPSGGTRSPDP
jgi:hypothetical protein